MRTGQNITSFVFSCLALSSLLAIASSFALPRGVDVVNSLTHTDHARSAVQDQPLLHTLSARITPLDNKAYLPAQIGGIIGAYALCLVIVAFTLLILSKHRREHLEGGEEYEFYQQQAILNRQVQPPETIQLQDSVIPYSVKTPLHNNFSYPLASPVDFSQGHTRNASNALSIATSFNSTHRAPGVDPSVNQTVVSADREMAQSQLEEMYKYVMEQEEAKANGVTLAGPPSPLSAHNSPQANTGRNPFGVYDRQKHQKELNASSSTLLRKEKSKPKSLNLSLGGKEDKERTSRTSSILSALKSPRKKKEKVQGLSISSPIMTPMSGTFPRGHGVEGEEMNPISPRFYAPSAPPPVPSFDQQRRIQPRQSMQSMQSQSQGQVQSIQPAGAPITPDMSPLSTFSIDERIGSSIVTTNLHARSGSNAPEDPDSAVSADSSAPLVGLPSSPKPGVNRFPTLPSSPRASSFQTLPASPRATSFRQNAPTAVRTGGALPLRAYEPSLASPSYATHNQTKQTVFERAQPLSPTGAQTPWTGAPVPYSPYQPFSPLVPITPSLVTKADRKRMKRYEPKTPTVEMVASTDETW